MVMGMALRFLPSWASASLSSDVISGTNCSLACNLETAALKKASVRVLAPLDGSDTTNGLIIFFSDTSAPQLDSVVPYPVQTLCMHNTPIWKHPPQTRWLRQS